MSTIYVNGSIGSDTFDGTCEVNIIGTVGPKATFEAGLAAAVTGDRVRITSGTYDAPNTTGYVITKSLDIQGDPSVILRRTDATTGPIIDIQIPGGTTVQNLRLSYLKLRKQTSATVFSAGAYGIKCALPASTNTFLEWLQLDNINVVGTQDCGFFIQANNAASNSIIFPKLNTCTADSCFGDGFRWDDGAVSSAPFVAGIMDTCWANNCQLAGGHVQAFTGSLNNCYFESNCRSATLDPTFNSQLRLKSSRVVLSGTTFEDFTGAAAQPQAKRALIIENSIYTTVLGCRFVNNVLNNVDTTQRCIYIHGGGGSDLANNVLIGPCGVTRTTYFLEVAAGNTNVDAYLPFPEAPVTVPLNIIPATMHMRSWT